MELRHQIVESKSAKSNQLPEFKRQNMLALLRRVKGMHEPNDLNEMVERVKSLEARHPEALMDLEMRQVAWEIIEKLLKIKPGSETEAETEERFKTVTFLETKFLRVPANPKKLEKRRVGSSRNHPSLEA